MEIVGRIHLPPNRSLMDDSFVKWAIDKNIFVFHPILMKLGEVVDLCVHCTCTITSPSLSKSDEKQKKKVLLIDNLTDESSVKP